MRNAKLNTLAMACSFLALGTLTASEALAQRGGGGGRGGGGNHSYSSQGGSPSRNMQTSNSSRSNINTGNVNRNTNVNTGNVNRNTNINTGNVNINVDHNYGYDYGDHYHPVARAAVVTAAVVTTAAVMGSYYRTLPANCVTVYRGAVVYYQCGSAWYQPSYYGSSVQYVVVVAP